MKHFYVVYLKKKLNKRNVSKSETSLSEYVSRIFLNYEIHLRFALESHTRPYFPRRIARSLNDVPPSKSAAHDKDSSRKKPIRHIFILLIGVGTHVQSRLSQYSLFFFPILQLVAETRFTMKCLKRVRERTKQDREMTRYREAPVELFSPVESGVTVAVLRTAPRAEMWEIQSRIYF